MNKSTNNTKCSAVFLATLLVAGIIALSSPSFMTGAQAVPFQGKDNFYKNSYGKDSWKCNNINVNINGVEIEKNLFENYLAGLQAQDQDQDQDQDQAESNAFRDGGSGAGNSGFDNNAGKGSLFVCINKNDNSGQGGAGEVKKCKDCFADFALTPQLLRAIAGLSSQEIANINTQYGLDLTGVNNVESLCKALIEANLQLSVDQILEIVNTLLPDITPGQEFEVAQFFLCLINAGIIDLVVGTPPV